MAECHEKFQFGSVAKIYTKFQGKDGYCNSNKISENPKHTFIIHCGSENGVNTFLRNCGNAG